ncbi:MAG: type II toxin-antitoxin system PemK/MazF family toxin [Candidatus Caenarcaniphilales bacterium]|nr:type II toxin-antitoxin system PemK/MazF family toxin [Candidatus Caenarcaniphilales bacterium]
MNYKFGDLVLVDFPFSSSIGHKKRPAVVISSNDFNNSQHDVIMMAITSKVSKLSAGEAIISEWQDSGLLKESALKSVIFTIEKEFIYKQLGKLSENDLVTLKSCLSEIFKDLKSFNGN